MGRVEGTRGSGDSKIVALTQYLIRMTDGLIHLLYLENGEQCQTQKNEGACNRSREMAKKELVSREEDKKFKKMTSMIDECLQERIGKRMARPSRGRGRGGRGRPRQGNPEDRQTEDPGSRRGGRRTTQSVVQEAAQAYQGGTNEDIRCIIQNLESSVLEEQSASETKEWAEMVRDPRNTRGRLTLYRQSLHIYWALKCLLAKAME